MGRSSYVSNRFIFFLFLTVIGVGVNVPHWDEWDAWLARIPELRLHGITWTELWQAHNGHRFPLTRYAFWLFSNLQLGPKFLMIAHTSLWLLNLELLWKIILFGDSRLSKSWRVPISFLFLSFCQREVFFFGMNLHFTLSILSLLLMIWFLLKQQWVGVFASVLLAVSSFSTWICLVPLLVIDLIRQFLIRKNLNFSLGSKLPGLGLLGLCLVLAVFYFGGMPATPVAGKSRDWVLAGYTWVIASLRTLGNPFFMSGKHQNVGLHLLAISCGVLYFVLLLRCLFREKNSSVVGDFYGPLLLVTYSFCCALVIGLGRSDLGVDAIGQASRYSTLVMPGWVGLLVIVLTIESRSSRWLWVAKGLLGLGLFCSLVNFYAEVKIRRPKLLMAQAVIQRANGGVPLSREDLASLAVVYPDPTRLVSLLKDLKSRYPSKFYNFMFN